MKSLMKPSSLASYLLALFLLFPFAYLLLRIPLALTPTSSGFLENFEEFLWALKNSLFQSLGSAILALLLGIFFCSGLIWSRDHLPRRFSSLIEVSCLVPGMLPSLFTILILLSLIQPFPMGILGIVLIHGILYSGFLSLAIFSAIEEKALSLLEVSYVFGVSRLQMWWQTLRLLKWEIFSLFILVFSVCFTSFAVPITVGGGRGTTLEILIYEKIRLSGAWGQALSLALIQSVILFIFSLLQRSGVTRVKTRAMNIPLLGSGWGASALVGFLFLFFGVFLLFSAKGWMQFEFMQELLKDSWATIPQTVGVGILCGALTYLLLIFSAFAGKNPRLRRFLNGFIAPSTSLVGLVVVLLKPDQFFLQIGFFILGFCSLVLCGLYRMGFDQQMVGLQSQIEAAETLGAGELLLFRRVTWPQMHPMAARLAGISSMWIIGDFALSKIIFSSDVLVAQVSQGLVNSYRLDSAMAMMDIVVILGLLVYSLFERFGHVRRFTS
jgi:thiamine transport system permease protein